MGHVIRIRANAAAVSIVVAAALGVLAVAGCGTATSSGQSPAASPSTSHRSPAPHSSAASPSASATDHGAIAGFEVLSMTFVSDVQGFALGTARCGAGRCLALLGTSDGGATWQRLTSPTTAAGGHYNTCPSSQPCVQQLRFATPLIGYAFDPSLFVTNDGGQSWRQVRGAYVGSLEAADGTVARVAFSGTGCAGMPYSVDSAPVGSNTWASLPAPPITKICPPVLYRQHSRIVLVGYGNPAGGTRATALIDRSNDGGRTWAAGPDSCGASDGYASGVALAPPNVLVLLCQHQIQQASSGFDQAWVRVSTDGGASFGPDQMVPLPNGQARGSLVSYQIAAASSGRLVIVETGQAGSRVLLTDSGGRRWSAPLRLTSAGSVLLVGFQDQLTARVAQGNQVWTTRDGGRSWTVGDFASAG